MSGSGAARVYRLLTEDGTLLYVGCTSQTMQRRMAKHHHRSQGWWADVAEVRVEEFETREEALAAEAAAIFGEDPKHNKAPGKSWSRPRPSKESPQPSASDYRTHETSELAEARLRVRIAEFEESGEFDSFELAIAEYQLAGILKNRCMSELGEFLRKYEKLNTAEREVERRLQDILDASNAAGAA